VRDDGEARQRFELTRAQVAQRLGISVSSVRRLEWDRLHPEVDDLGVHRFSREEVDALGPVRRRAPAATHPPERREGARKGRLAAKVFRLFARNLGLPQIVVLTKQPPDVIRALYHEWSTSLEQAEWDRERPP
jgi:hypothetical protein